MHRTDDENKAVDLFGSGKHGFQSESTGQPATRLSADEFNAYQEELAGPIEAIDMGLLSTQRDQLLRTLRFRDAMDAICRPFFVNAGAGGEDIYAMADGFGAGMFYVGSGGLARRINRGEDGTAMTVGGVFSGIFQDVAYAGNGEYYAVAVGEAEEIQTTGSGADTSYTQRNTSGSNSLLSVCLAQKSGGGDRIGVAVGISSTIYESTEDRTTWNDRSANSAYSGDLYRVVFSIAADIFIAVGSGGIQTSADGITWVGRRVGNFRWAEVTSQGIIAMGTSETVTSTDGVTWTPQSSGTLFPAQTGGDKALYCAGIFTAFSVNGSGDNLFQSRSESAFGEPGGGNYRTPLTSTRWRGALWVAPHVSADGIEDGLWLCGSTGVLGYHPFPFGRGY